MEHRTLTLTILSKRHRQLDEFMQHTLSELTIWFGAEVVCGALLVIDWLPVDAISRGGGVVTITDDKLRARLLHCTSCPLLPAVVEIMQRTYGTFSITLSLRTIERVMFVSE